MALILEQTKPEGLCSLDGCYTHVKNKRRKYCSRECHEKAIGAKIPKCGNPACEKRVKRGRNQYCSWECYKVDNDTNAHEKCQRVGCCTPLVSRKSTRKYCSQDCYRLDHPNRPSRKVIRICTLPGCGKRITRRGNGRKFCSVACSVVARKKLKETSCPTCNTVFSPKRFRQIYCSDKCRRDEKEFTTKKVGSRVRRFTKVNKKWVLTAEVTWQTVHGDVPHGKDVWFKDGESFNDMDINNLYLVDHKEYLALSRKVTEPVEERMSVGKYEGRSEEKPKKEEFFDYTKEMF